MKRSLFLPVAFLMVCHATAQQSPPKQPSTIGIHVTFNDFVSAAAIRNTSLGAAIRDNQFGRVKFMTQGLALTYGKGMSAHIDFHSMLSGSFLAYPFNHVNSSQRESLLIEADASLKAKLFTDKRRIVPFLIAGTGMSKYRGYWAAFIPAGPGIQVNFFDEAFLIFSTQYRIAVTENASNHFFYSIGLSGNIGPRVKGQ